MATSASAAHGVSAPTIPFVDLDPVTSAVRPGVLADWQAILDHGDFVNGEAVELFEHDFATWTGRAHCVGVASGLDALRLALDALEIGQGDEVLVPALTFAATFEAVAQVSARPVPVDVDELDAGIDADALRAAVSGSTRAVVPVHLYGQLANARRLDEVTRMHDLTVLEDACQAHGASRDGFRAGAWGRAAAFSFYPSKNLGAMGDAGALVTDDEEVADRVRALREHGQTGRYRSEYVGYTARLDTLQAVVLRHKLPLVETWNELRAQTAATYTRALDGIGDLRLPATIDASVHVWHLYTVRTAMPEKLAAHLRNRGIACGRHYPEPPHRSQAFAYLGHEQGSFPVAERIAAETLSLPMFPGIREAQVERVVEAVKSYFSGG